MAVTTWDGAVTATARELAHLLATTSRRTGWGPQEIDIEVALTARAAVLAGAANVLGDLAPRTRQPNRHGRRDLLALADQDPLRALGLVLRDRGRVPPFTRSPSELLDAAAPGAPATRSWAAAGRHALIGDRIWTAQARNLDADHAWHVVRQVTALAELVARLDPMLAHAAKAMANPDALAYLDRTAGLRVVAQEVAGLSSTSGIGAAGGTRDLMHPPIRAAEPARPITPVDGPTAVAATRRLISLVRAAGTIAPHQVRAVAHVSRDLAVLAAAARAPTDDGADLRRLGELATCLNNVVTGRHGEAALAANPAFALEGQVRELAKYTRDAFANRMPRPHGEDATRIASRLPKLVSALNDQARAQVEARRWAIPDRNQGTDLHYAVASADSAGQAPRMLAELQRSVDAAKTLEEIRSRPVAQPARWARADAALVAEASAVERAGPERRSALPTVHDRRRLPPSA
ncbi:hypothetical protein [Sporichthya polymorpha]|uniref:hypothetical protein n=1 Tax=Sporichthya polymorpha TaxID=35751 RepID=UPI00039E4B19|nr:hypothetical protein [Sporichthya polymorpha]